MKGGLTPRREAVALSWGDRDRAPVVVAKGYGVGAEAILRVARDAGVFVHGSAPLVKLLMRLELDREIPPPLYAAVAEVMAWVARVESGARMEQ